jgi:hypothetical protein
MRLNANKQLTLPSTLVRHTCVTPDNCCRVAGIQPEQFE